MNTPPKLYDFVMDALRAKTVPQKVVALMSGVPYSTVTKIAQGDIKNPGVHTVQQIADFFQKNA